MNRRDFLLQQMGLSQWQLIRPEALKGVVNMPISPNIRLIIIAEQELDKTQPIIKDILLSLDIQASDCLCVNYDFAPYLNIQHSVNYWLLSNTQDNIDRTLPYCVNALAQWQSPALSDLQQNPSQKRYLWQQIQQVKNTLCP